MLPQAPLAAQPPKPKGVQPKGVQPKGVQPMRCAVVQKAPPELLQAKLAPKREQEPVPQPFRAPIVAKPAKPVKIVPPRKEKKGLLYAPPTPNYRPRSRGDKLMDDPTLAAYQVGQTEIETRNPYLTNTVIYTPQTRRSFYLFILSNYADGFQLIPQIKGPPDEVKAASECSLLHFYCLRTEKGSAHPVHDSY